jgi:hypothetical protein
MKPWQDHAGVIHFHSHHSFDGRTDISTIITAAKANTLDFLMLTDHNTLQAREDGREGWHGPVLLIVGQEIAPRFNHYLAFGTRQVIDVAIQDRITPPQSYIDRVNAQGGLGFIAHPDHEGTRLFHVKPYPWLDWQVRGYTGMGIWDFMTDWQASLTGYGRALLAFLAPGWFLSGPRRLTLTRWDWLNRSSRVVGIGESDNHDTEQRLGPFNLSVFPFRKAFRYVRTHLLTETPLLHDADHDIPLLLESLALGRAYVAQESFAPARGFSFILHDEQAQAGSRSAFPGRHGSS